MRGIAQIMDAVAQNSLSHVQAAEAAVAVMDTAFKADKLQALRTLVASCPDTGAPGAGEVVSSLFMLLEHLIADSRMDHEALEVHVRAWRMMLTSEPTPEATDVLLKGLRAVRDRGGHAKAA